MRGIEGGPGTASGGDSSRPQISCVEEKVEEGEWRGEVGDDRAPEAN